ncbi:MAG TPA: type IV secretion system DNA-binding domain-containing protein [Candidatus Paceibacterota bacterium]|nr:type IV secretion system DNA-binding domain-containing protein [Candidatus Paceibacterota bacterium]
MAFALPFSKKHLAEQLELRLLEITLPRPAGEERDPRNELSDIKRSEQLFASLLSLGEPFVFEVAVHNVGTDIHFYIAVPRAKRSFAEQQILGLFPRARVEETDDYTIFGQGSRTAGGTLTMKEKPLLPIRTYAEAEVDTFAGILSSLGKLNDAGDGAALQIIVSPAPGSFAKSVRSAIERVQGGEKLSAILSENAFTDVKKAFAGSPRKEDPHEERFRPIDDAAVQALERKIAKPLLSAEVRIIVAAESSDRAADLLLDIAGSFGQFAGPTRNAFGLKKPRDMKSLAYRYAFREPGEGAMPMNTEELASIFHLPTADLDIPRIAWHSARSAEAPALPAEGIMLGQSEFRGEHRDVRLTDEDRRRHVYMVGQTGTGKSTLIRGMLAQDIARGAGACLIDPNGDLADEILGLVPAERIEDVIVFDPSELGRPLGLNMLEFDPSRPEQKTFIVNEMQSIFNRLYSEETMGPMFEQYMRNALLLLMEDAAVEPATLVEVPRIFTDAAWRRAKLERCRNPVVANFWREEAEKAGGEGALANMTPYITSKFGGFIGNDYMRPIIGQVKSAFDFRQVMDEGKILIVKLPKGRIGEINANLLGMVITGKLLMAALGRDDVAQEERRDFYLYIDEFQNFTTDSITTILSEARKYRLNLTIAHQYLGQLPEHIRDAVFGNAGTLVSFRVGTEDAEALEKHMAPNFASTDLITLPNLHAIIRPLVHGQPTRAFNMTIPLPPRGSPEVAEKLAELSRLTFGAPLMAVEDGIAERLGGNQARSIAPASAQ